MTPWPSDLVSLEGIIDFTIDTNNTDLPNFTEFDKGHFFSDHSPFKKDRTKKHMLNF